MVEIVIGGTMKQKFTKEHEWVKLDNEHVYVGITDFVKSSSVMLFSFNYLI